MIGEAGRKRTNTYQAGDSSECFSDIKLGDMMICEHCGKDISTANLIRDANKELAAEIRTATIALIACQLIVSTTEEDLPTKQVIKDAVDLYQLAWVDSFS